MGLIMDKEERILRDGYISSILVGECPHCDSNNTHDCQAEEVVFDEITRTVSKIGSECWAAKKINDTTIGHCDT